MSGAVVIGLVVSASALAAACSHSGDVIVSSTTPASDAPLVENGRVELADVAGRIDHCAFDAKRERLFVAALGQGSIVVVEWRASSSSTSSTSGSTPAEGRVVGRIDRLDEPQGVAYLADTDELAFTTGGDGKLHVHDGTTLKEKKVLAAGGDADNVRYDAKSKRLYVGCEEGLTIVDTSRWTKVGTFNLGGHAESFQLEPDGSRVYVNVPSARHVAVVDLAVTPMENGVSTKLQLATTWSLGDASSNFAMALDAKEHRLFVGCRSPACLLVLDTTDGKQVAKLPIGGDCDDVFLDAQRGRVYASCGAGVVSVVSRAEESIADVATAPGARTSLFESAGSRLFVAVPKRGSQGAEIRVLEVHESGGKR